MTKYTAFRCPEDLLAKAKIKAQEDRRSLSNYIITLIEKNVEDIPDSAIAGRARAKRPVARKSTVRKPAAKKRRARR